MGARPLLVVSVAVAPDIAAAKRAYGLTALADAEAFQAIATLRRIAGEPLEWPRPLLKVTAIAVAGACAADTFQCRLLAPQAPEEPALLAELFAQLDAAQSLGTQCIFAPLDATPLWPLLVCRALVYGLRLPMCAELESRLESRSAAWPLAASDGLSLRAYAAACGEPYFLPEARTRPTAPAEDAAINALLLFRLSLRTAAAEGAEHAALRAAFQRWCGASPPAFLVRLTQPLPSLNASPNFS